MGRLRLRFNDASVMRKWPYQEVRNQLKLKKYSLLYFNAVVRERKKNKRAVRLLVTAVKNGVLLNIINLTCFYFRVLDKGEKHRF